MAQMDTSPIPAPAMPIPASSGNPVLDEIDRAHASLSPDAQSALEQAHSTLGIGPPATPPAAAPSGATLGTGAAAGPLPSPGPIPATPAVPQTPVRQNLAHIEGTKSGIGNIRSAWGRVPLQILDVLGQAVAPRIEAAIPGTEGHHQFLLRQAEGESAAEDESRLRNAQAGEQEALPELHQSQAEVAAARGTATAEHQRAQDEHAQRLEDIAREKQAGTESTKAAELEGKRQATEAREAAVLAQHGFEKNEKGEIVPLAYEKMSEEQQAVHDLRGAQKEQAEATAALRKAQSKNQPAMAALAQKRLESAQQAHSIAVERLGLSEKQYEMRAHGSEGGVALPGALITDSGQTVGSANAANVRPTGQERNKADLATSAHEQLQDIKKIVAKRPDIFGPLAGRTTDFTVWLGSQDPDAQAFRAARTIAGDHLAGVFGGRSEAALQALDDAIGHFKDNPEAIQSGLDQLDKANKTFQSKGTVKTAGSNAAEKVEPIQLKDGRTLRPKDKAAADAFRKDHPELIK